MKVQTKASVLADHGDVGMVTTSNDETGLPRNALVQLDPDHPGFRDAAYRARRNRIAEIALSYRSGSPIPEAAYTEAEHEVWRTIWRALRPAHERHACTEYRNAFRRLEFDPNHIPQLADVNEKIYAISGFRMEPVAGLVEPRVFLESLTHGVFLCTQYIRHHETPLYTPEPDVVHEILGHGVTLASEPLAELNRLFGAAVERTKSEAVLEELARVYWFTIEFGVLRENGSLRAYGTGLLSSAGELEAMHKAELLPLDLKQVCEQEYDPTRFQPILFCAESFAAMQEQIREYLTQID